MVRLRGRGFGAGMALGSAGVLRAPNGIPLLPARMVAQMTKTPHNAPVEPMEVILIARDYEAAASLALPWARVVGIAAERVSDDSIGRGVPAVVGIGSLLDVVEDESLVLIDGDRGVVLVDPDGSAIAAYQAERDRIAPRHRFYLDYAHQPARTLDGRIIRVLALVETPDDVHAALDAGADALYVAEGSGLVPAGTEDDEQVEALVRLGESAAGKPITVAADLQSISMSALMRAAIHVDYALAVPFSLGTDGFGDLQHYLQEVREELIAEEIDFADFRVAGTTDLLEPLPDILADYLVGRVIVSRDISGALDSGSGRDRFERLAEEAAGLLLPVEVLLVGADDAALRTAIGLGASGLIVAPHAVPSIKERIRTLDGSDCRDSLMGPASESAES